MAKYTETAKLANGSAYGTFDDGRIAIVFPVTPNYVTKKTGSAACDFPRTIVKIGGKDVALSGMVVYQDAARIEAAKLDRKVKSLDAKRDKIIAQIEAAKAAAIEAAKPKVELIKHTA